MPLPRVLFCIEDLRLNHFTIDFIFALCRYAFVKTGRLAQLLNARYRCGRSGARFPGWSNRTQCRQRLATVVTLIRSCVAQAL